MVDATAQNVGVEQATDGAIRDGISTRAESGSVFFPELVRAHYAWEKTGCVDGREADRKDAGRYYWAKRSFIACELRKTRVNCE